MMMYALLTKSDHGDVRLHGGLFDFARGAVQEVSLGAPNVGHHPEMPSTQSQDF